MSLTSKPVRPRMRYFMMSVLYEWISVPGRVSESGLISIYRSADFRFVAPGCREGDSSSAPSIEDRLFPFGSGRSLADFSIGTIKILPPGVNGTRCLMNLVHKHGVSQ